MFDFSEMLREIGANCINMCFAHYGLVDRSAWRFDPIKGIVCHMNGSQYSIKFGVKIRSSKSRPYKYTNRLTYAWFDFDCDEFPYTLYYGISLPNNVSTISFSAAKGIFANEAFNLGYFFAHPTDLVKLFGVEESSCSASTEVMYSNSTIPRYAFLDNHFKAWSNNKLISVYFNDVDSAELRIYLKRLCNGYLEVPDILQEDVRVIDTAAEDGLELVECISCGKPFYPGLGSLVCPDCLNC